MKRLWTLIAGLMLAAGTAAAQQEPIRIGVLYPLTGGGAISGPTGGVILGTVPGPVTCGDGDIALPDTVDVGMDFIPRAPDRDVPICQEKDLQPQTPMIRMPMSAVKCASPWELLARQRCRDMSRQPERPINRVYGSVVGPSRYRKCK